MSRGTLIATAIISLVAIALAGIFLAPYLTPAAPSTTIRVGYLTADLHHIAYFVAKNKTVGGGQSFFEKYSVNVTDAVSGGYASGGVEMDAFAGGKVDIGFLGAPPAIIKHLNLGVNTTVIAQVNDIGYAVVVKPEDLDLVGPRAITSLAPTRSSIQYF